MEGDVVGVVEPEVLEEFAMPLMIAVSVTLRGSALKVIQNQSTTGIGMVTISPSR
ncbi:hypothetical protein PV371_36730 [Streptomyces sp. TX20-6-3]|uniref:hypothetical protein n=1 Tax=Streptomyces sp. TX20-6-3 TaxID=3028705 RepID=UPI0029B4799B|nr:hypothetical protein [Streptomyces sp. TX20-6-3]MDX2565170.1 hypothetical protein [Streptomyces sp. TX20-6-3]